MKSLPLLTASQFAVACLLISNAARAECCSDLEGRVAELEAAAVHGGTRKLEISLEGTVTTAALYWNDGQNSDVYFVTNDNEGTNLELSGDVEDINDSDWSSGFLINIDLPSALSSEVDQIDDDAGRMLSVNESYIYVENEELGQLSMGFIGGSSDVDDATEMDLSETRSVAYSGVEDIGGGFFLRRAASRGVAGLSSVEWSDLIDHLPGLAGNMVRYDSPTVKGWYGWAEWGQGPMWETALTYGDPATLTDSDNDSGDDDDDDEKSGKPLIRGFETAAAIGYQSVGGDNDVPDNVAVNGSISILHEKSGISLTVAGGRRSFVETVDLNNGGQGRPQDASFYYLKPSVRIKPFQAGYTSFYAEHGVWQNFLGRETDAEDVASLSGLTEQDVCVDDNACLVSSSRAKVWGFGAVQHINKAEMDLYLGFRLYQPDVNLVDNQGRRITNDRLDDFVTVMSGAAIDF